MTDQSENIIVVEACGWRSYGDSSYKDPKGKIFSVFEVSNHFNSIDAMQKAVLMQDERFKLKFDENLIQTLNGKGFWVNSIVCYHIHQLTATDWRSAFIETLKQLKRV